MLWVTSGLMLKVNRSQNIRTTSAVGGSKKFTISNITMFARGLNWYHWGLWICIMITAQYWWFSGGFPFVTSRALLHQQRLISNTSSFLQDKTLWEQLYLIIICASFWNCTQDRSRTTVARNWTWCSSQSLILEGKCMASFFSFPKRWIWHLWLVNCLLTSNKRSDSSIKWITCSRDLLETQDILRRQLLAILRRCSFR